MKKLLLVFLLISLMAGTVFAFEGNYYVYNLQYSVSELEEIEQSESIIEMEESKSITFFETKALGYITADSNEIDSFLVVNNWFDLKTNSWTTIGSENNFLARTIFIANNNINRSNIAVEVRDSRNNLLGVHLNLAPHSGFTVNIPANSGTYTVRARSVTTNGNFNVTVSNIQNTYFE